MRHLFIVVFTFVMTVCGLAQTTAFVGDVSARNTSATGAGTNAATLGSGSTPSLYLIRSLNAWGDTWWNWTMGTDNKLRLGFSTVPQLTFQNGAMGVGVDAPEARLHVKHNADVGALLETTTPNSYLILKNAGGSSSISSSGTTLFIGDRGSAIWFRNGADWSAKMGVAANGNVGIGVTNPQATLDVRSSGDNMVVSNWGVNRVGIQTYIDGQWANRATYAPDETRLLLQPDVGNVGIGTTNPTHKLTVNGTIRAKEVIVDTGWADYVFAEDYRLAPLSEVEAHIKEHKHLPDIPSATEVAEQGVSMGEMQARMMAKIEELTLHVIEQQKSIQAQQAKIEVLSAEVARLSKIE